MKIHIKGGIKPLPRNIGPTSPDTGWLLGFSFITAGRKKPVHLVLKNKTTSLLLLHALKETGKLRNFTRLGNHLTATSVQVKIVLDISH